MLLDKSVFASSMAVVDKSGVRPHLEHITIEYDDETKMLSVVGTDAQVMIVNEVAIKDPIDQEFCKKHFSEKNKGYMLPDLTDKKRTLVAFDEVNDMLTCNDTIVSVFDGTYPHWQAVVPTKNLHQALFYCGFNPDYIKKINKAVGKKGVGIAGDRPLVSVDENDPKGESLSPHRWNIIDEQERKQTVILMPLRLDF